jgi:hypothetical protein
MSGHETKQKDDPPSDSANIMDRTKAWLERAAPVKVAIATVCPTGLCDAGYVGCLVQTVALLRDANVSASVVLSYGDALVGRARRELVDKILCDPEVTHMIFINPDLTWQPEDVLKLLVADKDVVGGVTPRSRYDFAGLLQASTADWVASKRDSILEGFVSDEEAVRYRLVGYNVTLDPHADMIIQNNITSVRCLSMSFLLVRCEAYRQLFDAFGQAVFASERRDDGTYEDPDEAFCRRWTSLRGLVHADLSIALSLVSRETFHGNILSALVAGQKRPALSDKLP